VVLLICFVALLPFLLYPDLPQETDAELHIYRLAELSRLVRGGEFYPRWSPHFYYGYGYPIFNYYAPLGYYTGLLVEIWPVFNAVLAIKFVFMLGLVLAGLGMYGFVRDFVRQSVPGSAQWCRPAGYVAAAVYVYAPYIQYVDPHARGDLAESFSFGLFPLALWALHRFARTGRAGPWLAACFAIAAVILSHNLMAMVFFGLLTGWVLWQYVIGRGQSAIAADTPSRYLLPVTLLAGVGLAAFFWLPVALEQEAVNLSSLIGDGSHFDFRNHFLTLGTLLGFSPRLDWGATEQVITFNLGVMQWVIGLLGAVLVMSGRAGNRRQGLFFVLAAGLLVLWTGATHAVDPAQKCQSGKNKEAGKYAFCLQKAEAKLVTTGDTAKYSAAILKCEGKLADKWARLEAAAAAKGASCPDDPLTEADFKKVIDDNSDNIYYVDVVLLDALGEPTNTVTTTRPNRLEVTVTKKNKNGAPIADVIVTVASTIADIDPDQGSGLTNADGVATFRVHFLQFPLRMQSEDLSTLPAETGGNEPGTVRRFVSGRFSQRGAI